MLASVFRQAARLLKSTDSAPASESRSVLDLHGRKPWRGWIDGPMPQSTLRAPPTFSAYAPDSAVLRVSEFAENIPERHPRHHGDYAILSRQCETPSGSAQSPAFPP